MVEGGKVPLIDRCGAGAPAQDDLACATVYVSNVYPNQSWRPGCPVGPQPTRSTVERWPDMNRNDGPTSPESSDGSALPKSETCTLRELIDASCHRSTKKDSQTGVHQRGSIPQQSRVSTVSVHEKSPVWRRKERRRSWRTRFQQFLFQWLFSWKSRRRQPLRRAFKVLY